MSDGGAVARRRLTETIRYWDGNQATPPSLRHVLIESTRSQTIHGNTNTLDLSAVATAPLWF